MGQTIYVDVTTASQMPDSGSGDQQIVFPGPEQAFTTVVYTYETPNTTVTISSASSPGEQDQIVFTGDLSRVNVEWDEDRIVDIIVDGVSLLHGVGTGTALKCTISNYESAVAEGEAWADSMEGPWVDTHCLCPKLRGVDYTHPIPDTPNCEPLRLPGKNSSFLFDSQFLFTAQVSSDFTCLEILRTDYLTSEEACPTETFTYQHPNLAQYEKSCFGGLPKILSVGDYLYVACAASDMIDTGGAVLEYVYSVWLFKIDKSSMDVVASKSLTDYLEPFYSHASEQPPSWGYIPDVSFSKLDDDRLFVFFEYSRDGSGASKRGYAIFVIDTESLSVLSQMVGDIEDDLGYPTSAVGLRASVFYDSSSECWRFLAASFGERLYRLYDSNYQPTPGTYMAGKVNPGTSEIILGFISVPPEGGWTQDYWNNLLDLSYFTDLVSLEVFAVSVPGGG